MENEAIYKLIDLHNNETIYSNADIDVLRMFLNDIFWDEDGADFSESSFEDVYEALLCCEYDIEKTK